MKSVKSQHEYDDIGNDADDDDNNNWTEDCHGKEEEAVQDGERENIEHTTQTT